MPEENGAVQKRKVTCRGSNTQKIEVELIEYINQLLQSLNLSHSVKNKLWEV